MSTIEIPPTLPIDIQQINSPIAQPYSSTQSHEKKSHPMLTRSMHGVIKSNPK